LICGWQPVVPFPDPSIAATLQEKGHGSNWNVRLRRDFSATPALTLDVQEVMPRVRAG
jgi:hypothetical protein